MKIKLTLIANVVVLTCLSGTLHAKDSADLHGFSCINKSTNFELVVSETNNSVFVFFDSAVPSKSSLETHLLRRLTHSDRIAKSATIQIPASNKCTFRDSISDGELQGYCVIPNGAILNIVEAVGTETQNVTVKVNEGRISLRDTNTGLPNVSVHLFAEFPPESAREIGGGMMFSTQDCSFD